MDQTEQVGRLTEGEVRTRTRSESNKRRRGNDGEPIEVQDEGGKVEKAGHRRAQKRKMLRKSLTRKPIYHPTK